MHIISPSASDSRLATYQTSSGSRWGRTKGVARAGAGFRLGANPCFITQPWRILYPFFSPAPMLFGVEFDCEHYHKVCERACVCVWLPVISAGRMCAPSHYHPPGSEYSSNTFGNKVLPFYVRLIPSSIRTSTLHPENVTLCSGFPCE